MDVLSGSRLSFRSVSFPTSLQGCQILIDTKYQKPGKIYQITTKLPNEHKIYQMALINSKLEYNLPIFSIIRPSKIYPIRDFWFENIPSGNPGRKTLASAVFPPFNRCHAGKACWGLYAKSCDLSRLSRGDSPLSTEPIIEIYELEGESIYACRTIKLAKKSLG
jgi:hypothetical protein